MSACSSQPKPLYNYGEYSESYYQSKKELTADPGMYANHGYIYLKGGKTDKAVESFNKEKEIYPESAHFMDRMIKKIEVAEGKNND